MVKEIILVIESTKELDAIIAQSPLSHGYQVVMTSDEKIIQKTTFCDRVSLVLISLEHPRLIFLEDYFQKNYPLIPLIFVDVLFGNIDYYAKDSINPTRLIEDISLESLFLKISKRIGKSQQDLQEEWKIPSMLTPQEERILQLLAQGCTNKEIAHILGLRETTVKTYNYVLYQKLSVKNRTQAIIAAKKEGII